MIEWICKSFQELSSSEVYAILKHRCTIFVVEQNCVYQDIDDKDLTCHHLCGWVDGELIAYCRLLPKGATYNEVSIGRVCVSIGKRNGGCGRQLMLKAMEKSGEIYGIQNIQIHAQAYLARFYNSLGFKQVSEIYDEDGIEFMNMLLVREIS